jgi:hypothetical protein
MKEIWKDIPGYEGYYQVSNLGNVKRLETKVKCFDNGQRVGFRIVKEKILKQAKNSNGWYYAVTLSNHSNTKQINTHRLVAFTFIPNPHNYPLVMHKDNNGLNNHVSNLQWGTYEMNNKQPVLEGRGANQFGKYGKK